MRSTAQMIRQKQNEIIATSATTKQNKAERLAAAAGNPSLIAFIASRPENSFCKIVTCRPFTTAVANCPSSGWFVNVTASYAKDMVFGGDAINGKKRQVVKATGKLDEFCKPCSYDEALQFVPEVSACGKIENGCDDPQGKIGSLPTPRLGGGWSDDNQMATAKGCIEGTTRFDGGSKSIAYLKGASSYEAIRRSLSMGLSVSAKGKINAMAFSGSIEESYSRLIEETQFSKSFYFLQTVELPASIFEPDDYGIHTLNKFGKRVYDLGPEEFRKVCGNRLITEVKLGASLYVTLTIQFASHYDKETFETYSKASFGGIAEAKMNIEKAVQTYKLDGSLELSAYQAGGDASQLPKIFGKCDKHYCVAECALNNLKACDGIVAGIPSYAQNNFPEQINFKNGVVEGSAAPISYTMPELSDVIGVTVAKSVVTSPIIAARKFFGELYTNQTEILTVVKHTLDFPEAHHIPGDIALKNLEMARDVLKNNVATIESAGLTCYSKPSECEELQQTIAGKLTEVTLSYN